LAEFANRFMTRSMKKQRLIEQSMNQKISSDRVSSSGKKCTCVGLRALVRRKQRFVWTSMNQKHIVSEREREGGRERERERESWRESVCGRG
jgi:hypothetical protein